MSTYNFYTYIWYDPKDGVPRYVGKGQHDRVWKHIENVYNTHYSRLLRKRFQEGYICIPKIFWVNSEEEAFSLEIFLIAQIGRADLKKGPLLNRTSGGEGTSGYIQSSETRRKISESRKNLSLESRQKISEANKKPKPHTGPMLSNAWIKRKEKYPLYPHKPGPHQPNFKQRERGSN